MEDEREHHGTILWLVWGTMLFSMVIYTLVPSMIPPPPDHQPMEIARGNPPKIALVLGIASLVLVPMLFSLRSRMFFEPLGEEYQPGTDEAHDAYFTMSLTSWALCEAVGVFGFAVYLLTYTLIWSIPFVILGILLLLIFRPVPELASETADEEESDETNR